MGLPPGEIAPGSPSPAAAAEGLPGSDGPGSIDGTAGTDRPAAVNGPVGMPEPSGTNGPGSVNGPGSAEGAGGAQGAGSIQGAGGAEGAARSAAPRRPVVPRARPSTGDPRVDDAVARLDDLAGLPIAEHLAVFEYVHERLTEALGDLDVHAPVRAGDHSPGAPGG
jgi:hypothetical protein